MHPLDWILLDTLQAGGLFALGCTFALDALARRDRTMGWLSATCVIIGLRHGLMAFSADAAWSPDLADRGQSLLVALGFTALCQTLRSLFPQHVPARFPAWIAAALAPSYLRIFALPHPSPLATACHQASVLVYLVGCGLILVWTRRARQEGDPLAKRLFLGLVGLTLPVVVELAALSLYGLKLRLSGFSLMALALTVGTSWQWLVVTTIEARIHHAEREAQAWRSLVPGQSFHTGQPSQPMQALFGPDWAAEARHHPGGVLRGADGINYRLRSRPLHGGEAVGWIDRDDETRPGLGGFLFGWTVGLGMDEGEESLRLIRTLRNWGAEVRLWGTVPPREGPYPSLLLWGREPSILAVWREGDLQRRKARWVQLGGPSTAGPHVRLDPNPAEEDLRQALEELISRR